MGKKDTIQGLVVSDKMDKTIVVAVETVRRHPLYKKARRHLKKYMAHDEGNVYHVGDKVEITAARPLSRRKRWRVVGGVSSGGVVPGVGGEE
jgi:small subunit ribosomal protein S17